MESKSDASVGAGLQVEFSGEQAETKVIKVIRQG